MVTNYTREQIEESFIEIVSNFCDHHNIELNQKMSDKTKEIGVSLFEDHNSPKGAGELFFDLLQSSDDVKHLFIGIIDAWKNKLFEDFINSELKGKTLKDTIKFMESNDFKERLIAEYFQLRIRIQKLNEYLSKSRDVDDNFISETNNILLQKQVKAMAEYAEVLKNRANIGNIKLSLK